MPFLRTRIAAARQTLSGWSALLRLLRRADGRRTALFAVLVLAVGTLPTVVILATGALVAAVPAAVRGGAGGLDGALLALAGVAAALVALTAASNLLTPLSRSLDAAFTLEVHHRVARATLGPPGLAPLEDPALADQVEAVQEAEQRGILDRTASELAYVAVTRLRGAGAFVVLLGFAPWAALLLAAAWWLTNRAFLRAIEQGIAMAMGEGAVRLRRSEYLRSLAVEPAAAKEVRVFGLGAWAVDEYAAAWRQALNRIWASRGAARGANAVATLALVAAHAVVLGALAAAALRGEVGAAALLVFAQAVLATCDLGLIGDSQWMLAQSLGVARAVAALDAPAELPLPPPSTGGPRGKVSVRLDGVRFTYRRRERPTLDGLTLEIPAGQSLAIVGENGAGKTTLVKLLCGLYEPDAGSVTLDGSIPPSRAQGRVGAIFQDFVRYRLPLRENVGFGHLPSLQDTPALAVALADAGGEGVLARLPAGWDTVLSRDVEGGADLSGGEWQRVALARALAAVRGGAGLLILDEPTASLDVRAETELFERFLRLTRGVTTVLVSHRLSSVRRADRIVVVEDGRVVEDGSHDELLRAGGRYAAMFALQAQRFSAGPGDGGVDA